MKEWGIEKGNLTNLRRGEIGRNSIGKHEKFGCNVWFRCF
jgi:hypothetical protein